MNNKQSLFKNVSLLITHYNRSSSLERLLKAFKDRDIIFGEVIVSDDASKPVHLNRLKELKAEFGFTLITTETNRGLGNNLNKGQLAVSSPYTLYVQEDFIPTPDFPVHFQDALQFMDEDPDLDIVRFYAYFAYPYLEPYKKGFSKMMYKPWFLDKNKIYNYSDHPHLRRSTFFEKFGMYTEGIKSDRTEYEMCLSFIQNRGKALFYDYFSSLFIQENSAEEPSTVQRNNWKQSSNPLIAAFRFLYRQIKYNYDLHINMKFKRK